MGKSAAKPGSRQRGDPEAVRHVDKTPSALFFRHNSQLGPPYQVLVDTNFINFSIKNKVRGDWVQHDSESAAQAPPPRAP